MPFIVLIDSPLISRSAHFAEQLARHLDKVETIDLTGMTEQSLAELIDSRQEVSIYLLYAEQALAVSSWRTAAGLRLYIDASEVDIAAAVITDLNRSGASRREMQRTLSQEVEEILKEKSVSQRVEDRTGRSYADFVIDADERMDEAVISVARHIERVDPERSRTILAAEKRRERIDQMIRQYQHASMKSQKARIKRKLWMAVIKTTLGFKRIMDLVLSLVALVLLSPLFLFVALFIRLHDGGPVFYIQKRVGLHGREFPFPKFRSMVLNADALKDTLLQQSERAGDVTFKMKHDPRVTPIGRFIRRFSIDELTQLWCVMNGDMSIVGPRPPVPREVVLYSQEDRRRLEVKPGLTGIWQVSGRADIGFKQQVELDVLYIESHGFWLDVLLILKTIPAVFTGKGAY